jgi:alpha-tubulin suppressor-like RCC1 family protein
MVLDSDGSVWEWGVAVFGTIPGHGNPVLTPVETMASGSGITQVSAGFDHVLALRSDGTVLAWGTNDEGQLGNGTTFPSGTVSGPVQVSGLTNATQVAAGGAFSLAIHQVQSSCPCLPYNRQPGNVTEAER